MCIEVWNSEAVVIGANGVQDAHRSQSHLHLIDLAAGNLVAAEHCLAKAHAAAESSEQSGMPFESRQGQRHQYAPGVHRWTVVLPDVQSNYELLPAEQVMLMLQGRYSHPHASLAPGVKAYKLHSHSQLRWCAKSTAILVNTSETPQLKRNLMMNA